MANDEQQQMVEITREEYEKLLDDSAELYKRDFAKRLREGD